MKNGIIIIGAGKMGSGIAACSAVNGHQTVLVDVTADSVEKGKRGAEQNIDQLVAAGLRSAEAGKEGKALLLADTDYARHLGTTWLIIEAVYEDLAVKQKLFKELDEKVPQDIIITSNTSGMMLNRIISDISHPQRTAITHFWFPGHLIPLVEIVMGEKTDSAIVETLREVLLRWGKSPVVMKQDLPGQLANRILQAVIREAVNIVESGLASPEDVDTAIKMGMALRFPAWGPLEHIDAVGLDLAYSVQKDVLPGLCNSPEPPKLLDDLLKEGNLGHKTGSGIYDWSKKDMEELSRKRDAFIIGALKLLDSGRTPD